MRNQLYYGDNLEVLQESIPAESVDLVYLDPPFNSNRSYNVLFQNRTGLEAEAQIHAFGDTWTWSQSTEKEYEHLMTGGAPARVADAIQAMHGPGGILSPGRKNPPRTGRGALWPRQR